ncbi:MAG: hypothetical protein O2960_22915 [Verrucomicrobia bacterium]|nr:hypothetical protein [Verrucomicrobiota bacterium]
MQNRVHSKVWSKNRLVGWASMAVGAATGLILGLWSFAGPVPVPAVLGEYGDLSRRLARLGHIAFFGLGIINVLLAREYPNLRLSDRAQAVASWAMNIGNVFLPLTLLASAFFHPLKYTMPIPALAVFVALVIAACGSLQSMRRQNENNS